MARDLHALRLSASADDGKRLGAERKAAESCTPFHEVDLRGGCRGEDGPARGKSCWLVGDFFFMLGGFELLIFRVVFLIVFGSFWGAKMEPFWSPKSIKMRLMSF